MVLPLYKKKTLVEEELFRGAQKEVAGILIYLTQAVKIQTRLKLITLQPHKSRVTHERASISESRSYLYCSRMALSKKNEQ